MRTALKRWRRRRELEQERLHVRPWWREEAGSDALLELRAKLRLWLDRAREQRP